MAKSKRYSSKRKSKKGKVAACRARGHDAFFCDLAQTGRVLTTISSVITFVVLIVIAVLGATAVMSAHKLKDADQAAAAKKVGFEAIGVAVLSSALTGVLWWLVARYDMVSVISITLWIITFIGGIIWGHKHLNKKSIFNYVTDLGFEG